MQYQTPYAIKVKFVTYLKYVAGVCIKWSVNMKPQTEETCRLIVARNLTRSDQRECPSHTLPLHSRGLTFRVAASARK